VSTRLLDGSALGGAQVLLVDLDGTLVDSSAPVSRAWTAFAKRHGLDPDEVHAFAQGRPSSETVRLLAPSADHATEAALVEEAETTDTDGVFALPGAGDLLRSGYPLAIVVLEDSPIGIDAGRAAGARVIALRTTHGDAALARADAIIDNLAALFARGGERDC
jgi:sugar-phosphatase